MIMIVSVPMVMTNHGTVCIEQTQVLNSKGIDPGSHVVAMIIVIVNFLPRLPFSRDTSPTRSASGSK